MTSRLDKVDTSVNTIIHEFESIHSVFLIEIGVESRFDIIDNWFPADHSNLLAPLLLLLVLTKWTYLSSLLTKSPKPGVSTIVNFNLTPFSSISVFNQHGVKIQGGCALTCTNTFNLYCFTSICSRSWNLFRLIEFGLEQGVYKC